MDSITYAPDLPPMHGYHYEGYELETIDPYNVGCGMPKIYAVNGILADQTDYNRAEQLYVNEDKRTAKNVFEHFSKTMADSIELTAKNSKYKDIMGMTGDKKCSTQLLCLPDYPTIKLRKFLDGRNEPYHVYYHIGVCLIGHREFKTLSEAVDYFSNTTAGKPNMNWKETNQ